jgi:hypothetical protein
MQLHLSWQERIERGLIRKTLEVISETYERHHYDE